ncbi:hypothetical protein ACP4OV_015759 [Aristida adscensionis]
MFTTTPLADAGKATGMLADGAATIPEALNMMNNGYLRSASDYLELHPDSSALVREAWGLHVYMGSGGIAFRRCGIRPPSVKGDGSLSTAISVPAKHMERFRKLNFEL